ncbi:MAG: TdeIII family type II restriction endonuclease, partial [Bernardetiaceae bacterium]|nr:TdeIII family type II restriction endonuclease [Bernardetiaceae bacterium]
PFHEAFINAFSDRLEGKVASVPTFISLSSWLHGLNTSLGQSFFEHTAQILFCGEKKEFTTRKQNNLRIDQSQKNAIADIITDLSNGNRKPSLVRENKIIFTQPIEGNLVEGTDFTADVFSEEAKQVICVEIKTVKPNKSVFKSEKQKILEAKAALQIKYPKKDIKYFLAFPFDPLSETPYGYDKQRFMRYSVGFSKYFDEAEILLASEFWDYISGVLHTMESIIDIINAIATPLFMKELAFLSEPQNTKTHKNAYLDLLQKWFLYREHQLLTQPAKNKTDTKTQKLLNQSCFRNGEYNSERLLRLLQSSNII